MYVRLRNPRAGNCHPLSIGVAGAGRTRIRSNGERLSRIPPGAEEGEMRIAGSVAKSWLASELGVAFDRHYYFDPVRRHAMDRQCNEHVAETAG